MSLSCIYGKMGSGKSHFSLFYSLLLCNKYRKTLVTNFRLNLDALSNYCYMMGYFDFLNRLGNEAVIYISPDSHSSEILSISNSCVLFDEGAIYFFARNYRNTPSKFISDLVQLRHDGSFLIFVAQSEKQIDIQIKLLAFEIFHCCGISVDDNKLGNKKLIYKNVHRFDTDRYEIYSNDPKIRRNPLKTRLCANKTWSGTLSISDVYLFNCFKSFGSGSRLDQVDRYASDYDLLIEQTRGCRYYFNFRSYPDFLSSLTDSFQVYEVPKLAKFITFLFTKLPPNFTDRFFSWAKRLSRFQGFSKLEKFLFHGVFTFLILVPLFSYLYVSNFLSILLITLFLNFYLFLINVLRLR